MTTPYGNQPHVPPTRERPGPPPLRAESPISEEPLPPKNTFTSTAWWGIVVTLIGAGITFLVQAKKVPEDMANQLKDSALWLAMTLGGAIAAYVGRKKAIRPLSFSAPLKDSPHVAARVERAKERSRALASKTTIPLILIGLLMTTQGCASSNAPTPLVQVQLARQSYVSALSVITPLVQQGVWDPSDAVRQAMVEGRKEARAALDDAEVVAADPNGSLTSFNFLMRRALSLVDRILKYQAQAKTAARARGVPVPDPDPAVPIPARPQTRSAPWTPSPLPASLSRSSTSPCRVSPA